jgi:hypothetical protein
MPVRRIVSIPRIAVIAIVALLLGAALIARPAPNGTAVRADTSRQMANAALLGTPVPMWLVKWILPNATKEGAKYDLELIGEHCPSWAVTIYGLSLCYSDTSPEPSRWHSGTVATGGPVLNARSWSTTSAGITRTFPNAWRLMIFCQQTGSWVYGRWGWTNVWDYIGTFGGVPWFVSDGFVYTGSNGFVAGSCASTNWGDNPF